MNNIIEFENISEELIYDMADLFKVFGDSTRLRILMELSIKEYFVNELAEKLAMNQSAISHQLKILRQSRLIKSSRKGKSIIYSLADDHVATIISQVKEHIEED